MTDFSIDLEQARKRAKELLRAARAGEPAGGRATRGLRRGSPTRSAPSHRSSAITTGRSSSTRSRPSVRPSTSASRGSSRTRPSGASTVRGARSSVTRRSPTRALVPALLLGDRDRVAAELRHDPALPRVQLQSRNWTALLYVCHSCFLGREPERTPGFVETARLLLEGGADPNATAAAPNWPGSIWTPLYGAAGVAHEPELTRLLLEAGANPDDGESVYHACESRDHTCLRLLLDHGATLEGTNTLPHMLDYDDLEGVRLLLEARCRPGRQRAPSRDPAWAGRTLHRAPRRARRRSRADRAAKGSRPGSRRMRSPCDSTVTSSPSC